jgi:hypothetical protein
MPRNIREIAGFLPRQKASHSDICRVSATPHPRRRTFLPLPGYALLNADTPYCFAWKSLTTREFHRRQPFPTRGRGGVDGGEIR